MRRPARPRPAVTATVDSRSRAGLYEPGVKERNRISRRRLLAIAGAAGASAAFERLGWAAPVPEARSLSFEHTHTGERLSVTYQEHGVNLPDALQAIDRLLRDYRTGEVRPIEPALLDLLNDLVDATGTASPFHVISGFRSVATNEMLRARGGGVAKGSLHLAGRAVDVRLSDVGGPALRDAALELARGGVGHYPRPDFVHVDTGRVRRW